MPNRRPKKLNQSRYGGQRTHVSYELSIVLEMNGRRPSSSEVVSMMQAVEPRHGNDIRIRRRALPGPSLSRRLLAQPEMRPINAQLFADNLSCHWSPSMHTY